MVTLNTAKEFLWSGPGLPPDAAFNVTFFCAGQALEMTDRIP